MLKNKRTKRLKIVIFVSYTYPYVGSGIGNVALLQAENLVAIGHEVDLVSSNVPSTDSGFTKNNVRHLKLPANTFLERFNVPVPLFLFNTKVIDLIKNADIIHVHDVLYPSSLLATLIAKFYKKPVVLTQHIPHVKYPGFVLNFIERMALITLGRLIFSTSDKIIVLSSSVGRMLKKYSSKLIYIENGVDLSLFRPALPEQKKKLRIKHKIPVSKSVVMFVGRMVPKKGYRMMFEARDPEYLTVFVGGGPVSDYMIRQKNTLFLGAMVQRDLSEIYQLSDIFVLPSQGEGFPLTIQEAMASGLPIITSKNTSYSRYLNVNIAKLINPSSKNIRFTIKKLLKNKSLMEKMGKYSYKTARKKFNWQENVNKLLKVYEELVN